MCLWMMLCNAMWHEIIWYLRVNLRAQSKFTYCALIEARWTSTLFWDVHVILYEYKLSTLNIILVIDWLIDTILYHTLIDWLMHSDHDASNFHFLLIITLHYITLHSIHSPNSIPPFMSHRLALVYEYITCTGCTLIY